MSQAEYIEHFDSLDVLGEKVKLLAQLITESKHLISQNTDGLHRRSGFPPEHLSELHGNTNLELCKDCGTQYLRDLKCRIPKKKSGNVHNHETGRICSICGGILIDSIINFGEQLPEKSIKDGIYHSKQADLCLVLGSSLRVQPASDIPTEVLYRKQPLVIVNLQSTPLDNGPYNDGRRVPIRINAKCDDVMQMLMKELGLEVDPFILRRYVKITIGDDRKLTVQGVDVDEVPFSLFTKVSVKYTGVENIAISESEPFQFNVPESAIENSIVIISMEFMGHYLEPKLEVKCTLQLGTTTTLCLEYDPMDQQWHKPFEYKKNEIKEMRSKEEIWCCDYLYEKRIELKNIEDDDKFKRIKLLDIILDLERHVKHASDFLNYVKCEYNKYMGTNRLKVSME
jgi:NAD-dependent SIR2 family protein deacetylase